MKKNFFKKQFKKLLIIIPIIALLVLPSLVRAEDKIKTLGRSPLALNEETTVKVYFRLWTLFDTSSVDATFSISPGGKTEKVDCAYEDNVQLLEGILGPDSAGTETYSCSMVFSSPTPGDFSIQAKLRVWYTFDTIVGYRATSEPLIIKVLDTTKSDPAIYNFLAPFKCDPNDNIPGCTGGQLKSFDPSKDNALSTYLNIIIKILIGIAAVLAVIMIVMGGIEYMTSDFVSSKEEGKKRITNAIIGLLIALGAYLILYTVNPNLLKTIDVSDEKELPATAIVDFEGAPEGTGTFSPISKKALQELKVECPGSGGIQSLPSIAKSFRGKVTYNNDKRGTIDNSSKTIYLDCSSFVAQVYSCAGLSNPTGGIGNTSGIFAYSSPIQNPPDISTLKVGDLVGWTKDDYKTKYGHVMMYMGGGEFIHTPGFNGTNNAVQTTSVLLKKLKWINPAP